VSGQPRDVASLRLGLISRWRALITGHDDIGDDLVSRYADSSRHYHDLEHLTEVLDHLDLVEDEADDPFVVRLAGWFHDAVYETSPAASNAALSNEERSARLAESVLSSASFTEAQVAEVARLVRLTATHATDPADRNGGALCDADLAILASPPERYRRYVEAVRREYATVPDDAFRSGRAAILRQLLRLPRLFTTSYGSEHWEATARRNLEQEIVSLES
jgi:predicted metal-dependent HD superfamily phosphohydrolase